MTLKQQGFFAALTANIVWGFVSIPVKAPHHFSAEQILFFRILVSLAFCWSYILLFKFSILKETIKTIRIGGIRLMVLLLLSGILITLNWYSFIYTINHINLQSAAFAYMVCPLITAAAGFILLKEEITISKLMALGIALVSILLLATGTLSNVLWSVMIACFYAFYLITQKVLQQLDAFIMLGINFLIAFLLTLPFSFGILTSAPTSAFFWTNIAAIASIFTLIPLFFMLYALKRLPSSSVGIIIYINPLMAFTLAFFYFHENISIKQIIAYLLLVLAVIVFNSKILYNFIGKIKKPKLVE